MDVREVTAQLETVRLQPQLTSHFPQGKARTGKAHGRGGPRKGWKPVVVWPKPQPAAAAAEATSAEALASAKRFKAPLAPVEVPVAVEAVPVPVPVPATLAPSQAVHQETQQQAPPEQAPPPMPFNTPGEVGTEVWHDGQWRRCELLGTHVNVQILDTQEIIAVPSIQVRPVLGDVDLSALLSEAEKESFMLESAAQARVAHCNEIVGDNAFENENYWD